MKGVLLKKGLVSEYMNARLFWKLVFPVQYTIFIHLKELCEKFNKVIRIPLVLHWLPLLSWHAQESLNWMFTLHSVIVAKMGFFNH